MKLCLTWFSLLLACSCCCAQFEPTFYDLSYEETLVQEDDPVTEIFTEENPSTDPTSYPTSDDEDTVFSENWFSTMVSIDESVTAQANITGGPVPEEIETASEMSSYSAEEEDWYPDQIESKLRIEYTPYSALLYQDDEFGLEFLCPGYWLQKGVLLTRGDFWPKDTAFSIEDTVAEIFPNNELNLAILRLHLNLNDADETEQPHLTNIREHSAVSMQNCALYVLQEDYALFEMYYWAIRPLPFKRARALCPEHHICLRTRPSAAYGLDYALICDQSLVATPMPPAEM
ncbi:uncharacterized protein LOC118509293 isoform X2 [Anopheles stephensi]|uniref:uncharacterized protein LOC118509293 isoform X2 n=1 Tax=Anopheles stephensi TaxID=30069 RepID=UPI001658771C|nr:uncharacterized protein LOC118509293 isoform X2 [Anopheles stephensi]